MDELRQIFDGINVVMRRRRNQSDAGHGITQFRNVFGHLVPRQLASFTGFRALRHLDLNLIGAEEILFGHPEATGGYLLDAGAQTVARLKRHVRRNTIGAQHVRQRHPRLHRRPSVL